MPGATLKVHEILPGRLYQRGMTVGERSFSTLEAYGIHTVVCCIKSHDPVVEAWLTARGMEYTYFPFADGKRFDQQALLKLGDYVARRAFWHPVLVHCHAGRNRSGLVNALALRRLLGITGLEAMERVRRSRPNAIANPHFAAWLESLPEEPAWI